METTSKNTEIKDDPIIESMFSAGAHFGFAKSRRHPSVKPYIFGSKNRVEIFDLEKTKSLLTVAKDFVKSIGAEKGQILLVSSKNEAKDSIKSAGEALQMPYVSGRWIGGTLTNFAEIRGRVDTMIDLLNKKEKGELSKYTKKERLLIDREIERLQNLFSGIVSMKSLPKVMFVIDPVKEKIAVTEAKKMGMTVIALLGSDCDVKSVDYPIIGNDSSIKSVKFFVNEIVQAYRDGEKNFVQPAKAVELNK